MVYPNDEIVFSNENEPTTDRCNGIDDFQVIMLNDKTWIENTIYFMISFI